MIKRKPTKPRETPFERFPELTIGNRTIVPGDPVKVRYKRGVWTFQALVTNKETGSQWVDVLSPATMHGPGSTHAVRLEAVSPVPRRRRRK